MQILQATIHPIRHRRRVARIYIKCFNFDTIKITSVHLTSKQLQKIIKALDETRKEYEDDGNHQLEVASLKFKILYHKANIDKMSGRVN